jgi:glucokinase
VELLNDFAAIAYSVPFLGGDDLLTICSPEPRQLDGPDYTVGVIGPGTGLGAEGLRKHGSELILIESEGPHSGFAPETAKQVEILQVLRKELGRVSPENLVSGPGIENLYRVLRQVDGLGEHQLSAAAIFDAAQQGKDSTASDAVDTFFEILGQVAGDFALTIGAVDGIFIAGGIAQRYPDMLSNSRFRHGFEHKGGHKYLMEAIPTQLIRHTQPGLLGAAYSALRMAK